MKLLTMWLHCKSQVTYNRFLSQEGIGTVHKLNVK